MFSHHCLQIIPILKIILRSAPYNDLAKSDFWTVQNQIHVPTKIIQYQVVQWTWTNDLVSAI